MWDFVFLFFSLQEQKKHTWAILSNRAIRGNDCECGGEEPDSRMNTT